MCPEQNQIGNEPGKLDSSFGIKGKLLLELPGFLEVEIRGLCIDETSSKIYAAATVMDASAQSSYALIRLNPDGSLDTEFAGTGFVTGQFREGVDSLGRSITLETSGRLLLSGLINQTSCLVRYKSTGQLDTEFGRDGKVVLDVLGASHSSATPNEESTSNAGGGAFSKACPLPDGKILITSNHTAGMRHVGLLIRLHNNGSLDTSFKGTGYLIVSHPSYSGTVTELSSVTEQPDGNYLGFGSVWNYRERITLLMRCDANGNMDASIGPAGFRLISSEDPANTSLSSAQLVEQSDGRMLVAAYQYSPSSGVLTSLTANGIPDSRFNEGKQVTTQLGSSGLRWNACAVQDDQKILVTGYRRSAEMDYDLVLARFLETGELDLAFNGKGWVTNGEPKQAEEGSAVLMQKDGKIIVAGYEDDGIHRSGLMLRYLG